MYQHQSPYRYCWILATHLVTQLSPDTTILCGVLGVSLCLGYGGHILTTLLGYGYPGYCCVRIILSQDQEDTRLWLRYWVVISSLSPMELVLDLVAGWMPGYFIAKCVFLCWCLYPSKDNGSDYLFTRVSRVFIRIHLLWSYQ